MAAWRVRVSRRRWCVRVHAIKRVFFKASRFNLFFVKERDYDAKERSAARRTRMNWHAPLIPLVALVEFPPKKALLSNNTTEPPFSKMVCAADKPAKPPPMTITLCCWDILSTINCLLWWCVRSRHQSVKKRKRERRQKNNDQTKLFQSVENFCDRKNIFFFFLHFFLLNN